YLDSKCDDLKVVIGGEGNFRDDLPLPSKYKWNRQDMQKPALHAEAVDYIKRKYRAEEANGWEADDLLCAYAWEGYTNNERIVAATVDKDANQQMGWLFNYDKMQEPTFIDGLGKLWRNEKSGRVEGYGRKWLYFQWIAGDPSDGYKPTEIAGIRWGDVSSFNALRYADTDRKCVQIVHDLYKMWYPDVVEYESWDGKEIVTDHVGIMQLYFDCARMMRHKEDHVYVKEILGRMNIE